MSNIHPADRVGELIASFSGSEICLGERLCDQYDPASLAYRVVAPDLSAQDLTYGDLRMESERFAAALRDLGVGQGDRVATLMGKSRQYLVTLMAIWRLGAVHVPLFTAFAPPAIALRLDGSKARLVVCDAAQQAKLAPSEHIPDRPRWQVITTGLASNGALAFDDLMQASQPGLAPAVVGGDAPIIHVYTSGTTGNPKGVIVPVRALASFQAYAEFGHGIIPETDIFWCAADPGWAYGLYFGILATFLTGVRSILFEGGFTPETTIALLENEEVTNFAAAPTVYRALRSSGLNPQGKLSLRCASSAGEPLTPEVNEWAETALGVKIHDHYGQTEAGMLINNHHHPALSGSIKPGSMGRVMPGWKATILHPNRDEEIGSGEQGRVAMFLPESPLAWFNGYDGDPTKTAGRITKDGQWYLTGDNGRMDDEGYFYFSAREDDVIIMAGYRIGPFEVEAVMSTHPAIAECAVIAVPDEVRGEVVEAYVVLRGGYEPAADLERDIQQLVKREYAAHAYPRRVHFTSELPKTPSGKIKRFALKKQRVDAL